MAKQRKYLDETKEAPAAPTAETSSDITSSDCETDDSTSSAESQEEVLINQEDEDKDEAQAREVAKGRPRNYAFLVYEDSSYSDWERRLSDEHVEALISPWHDKDINPSGEPKKKHKHVLLMFDGHKSLEQINEIRERVIGPDYNRRLEYVQSIRGYARYLLHLDNPEKAQYDRKDIRELGGANFDELTALPGDDVKMLGDVLEYIRKHRIRYFSDFLLSCHKTNPDWFNMLVNRKSFVVIEFIKSEAAKAKDEVRRSEQMLSHCPRSYAPQVDPETGEVVEGVNDDDSQN